MRAKITILLASLSLVVSSASAYQAPAPSKQLPVATAPRVAVPTQADVFCRWLNGQRARYRLGAVTVDPGLNYTAYINNTHQMRRGMGHHHRNGDRRQNVGGFGSEQAIWNMWLASPAHLSALMDPTVTRIGYHVHGTYVTYCGS